MRADPILQNNNRVRLHWQVAFVLRTAPVVMLLLVCAKASFSQAKESISLHRAVEIALEKSAFRKMAVSDTKVSAADVRQARSFLLPRLVFSETATRGDDPVYVFGGKLRQQRFAATDFALNQLNTPQPFGNFATRFGGTWNLFDSFATWHGVHRAKQMDQAASHQLDRTDQQIIFRVVNAYYQVLMSTKRMQIAQQSVKTTESILQRSQARFDTGMAVESDLLAAKVQMAARQQDLIRITNDVALAGVQLNTAMGVPLDIDYMPDEPLEERSLTIPALAELEKLAIANRPDLKRIDSELAAQRDNVSIAKSSFGPRVNAFADWELDNPTLLAGGGGNNWLGGIELQIDIFAGGAKRAELSRQRALKEKIEAGKQAASDEARLEVRRAYYDVDASRRQIELARTVIAEAQENLRINQDRYESGLIIISELLGSEESERRCQNDYWEAVYRFYTSYASLELASGNLNLQSRVVTP